MAKDKKKYKYSSAKAWVDKQETGFTSTSVKLPEGFSFFNPKKTGVYRIDILPYTVGKGNPNCDEGMLHYERTYYVHRGLGSDEQQTYVCPSKTFGKRCPVCEEAARMKKVPGYDKDTTDALRPKIRQLWNVRDLNDPDKGVQVWDTAYFKSFGEMLKDKLKYSDEADGYEDFFHLEDGLTIKVTVGEGSFVGRTFSQVKSIDFVQRKSQYDDDVLKEVACLDDCPVEVPYEKLKSIFEGGGGVEEETDEDTPPRSSAAGKAKPSSKDEEEDDEDEDSDDEEEDSDDGEEDTPVRGGRDVKPSPKKSVKEDDEEEDEDSDDSEDEEEEDDDEDEEEAPPVKKGKKGSARGRK